MWTYWLIKQILKIAPGATASIMFPVLLLKASSLVVLSVVWKSYFEWFQFLHVSYDQQRSWYSSFVDIGWLDGVMVRVSDTRLSGYNC